MQEKILVTGATGVVGAMILNHLRYEGRDVVGASRKEATDGWVQLDFERPETFGAAVAGVHTAMLIARPGDEHADKLAAPLIDAMVKAGVRKICLLSALGAQHRPEFSLRKMEILVEAAGVEWTHVRPNFFMQMLAAPPLSMEMRTAGTLSLPLGDAKVAYVDARDVADLMVLALTSDKLRNTGIDLNGPEAHTHSEITTLIAQATGKPMRYVNLDETQARALLAARNFSPEHIERLMKFYALIRQDWCADTDRQCAELLGRPLGRFKDFAAANASCW